jgi:hypothetical protein
MDFEQLEFDTDGAAAGRHTSGGSTVQSMTIGEDTGSVSSQVPVHGLDEIEQDARRRLDDAKSQIAVLNTQARIFADIAETTAKVREALSGDRSGVVAFELTALQKRLADQGQVFPSAFCEELNAARSFMSSRRDAVVDDILAGVSGARFTRQTGTQYPSFAFDDGFYTLDFNAEELVVMLRTRYGRKSGIALPWDVDVVMAALGSERQRCFPAKPNVKALSSAAAKLAKKAPEGRVPVDEIFAELQKGKVVGGKDEFAVLLRDGSLVGAISLEHARNPSDGLLLPGLETQGRFGYVRVASAK